MMMKLCAAYRGFALYVVWIISAVTDVKKAAFVDTAVGFAKSEYHVIVSKFCGEGEAVLGGERYRNPGFLRKRGSLLQQLRFQMGFRRQIFYHVILLVK